MPRYFTRDADHPGYGPATPTLPPQQIGSETSNRTDAGRRQSQQPVARVPASVGPNTGNYGSTPNLPPAQCEQAKIDPATFAQPSLQRTAREVVARFPFEDGRYNYWTRSSGQGRYATWRTQPGDGGSDELIASHSGPVVGDANAERDNYVVYRLISPQTDLGKTSFTGDRFTAMRRDHAATSTLHAINAAHAAIHPGRRA